MLTRLISTTAPTELIEISPELYISKYFYEQGYRVESDISEPYNKHVLLQELYSGILNLKMRLWDAGGIVSVVFEDGVRYSMDEVKLMDMKSDSEILQAHKAKHIFGGEVIE